MKASATCGRTGDVPKGYKGAASKSRANAGISPGLLRPSAPLVMSQQVSFGRYRFEPATGRLWADQREIKLTRKAASVLGLLVERAGQPVTKQELFASVWSNTVVSDDALTTCIQELRKALGDDAEAAALHRDSASLRLLLRCGPGAERSSPGVRARDCRPTVAGDRSAAVHGHESRPRSGLLLRGPGGRADRRAHTRRRVARRCAQLFVPVPAGRRGPA